VSSTIIGESKYPRKALDAYWTRHWVTEWLLNATKLCSKQSVVWECACGSGWISEVLKARGYDVLSTDIVNHGYAGMDGLEDFMSVQYVDPVIQVIFTNPPYDIKGVEGVPDVTAEQFLRHAIKLMRPVGGKVIMILRNEFDSASTRLDLFSGVESGFAAKYVLTRRPTWIEEDDQEGSKSGPRHNYSWFCWDFCCFNHFPKVLYLSDPKKKAA
jgi:hypothetical protein